MEKKNTVYIKNVGCERRVLDAERFGNYFSLNGFHLTDDPETADYLILVTCGFKEKRVDESMHLVETLSANKGELIVAGCLPGILPEKLSKVFSGKTVVTKEIDIIDHFFPQFKIKLKDVADGNIFKPNPQIKQLRISGGCVSNCAYCGIRNAVGRLKSKPIDLIIEEYKKMIDDGFRKFFFVADDIGAYGLDIKLTFPILMERLSEIDKELPIQWYITEMDPRWIVKYKNQLLKWIKNKKIRLLFCPIQSGSRQILKKMNRYPDIETITQSLLEFKTAFPQLEVDTQIIIGFPSETDDDFKSTLAAIRRINFGTVFLNKYFDINWAASSKMENKIPEDIKIQRLQTAIKFLEKEKIHCQCDEFTS